MLGVVDIDDLQAIQAQALQAPLDRALELLAAKIAGAQIAVALGGQHIASRQPAKLAQHQADPALALAVAIGGGCIKEVDRRAKGRAQRGQRRFLGDAIGEGFGHIAQRRAAHTQRRDQQLGRAKWTR